MQDLTITLVQSNLVWENIEANLQHFSQKLDLLDQPTDLIVLPEMFSTGFSMNSEKCAEPMEGLAIQWMKKTAQKTAAVVCGSLIIEEDGKVFNRFVWMRPDGSFISYNKRHLFSMADENDHFTAGTQRLLVELKGWVVCPLICYDLRFPVWSRQKQDERYDLLLYVANWPEPRSTAWSDLLKARAHENQCYVAGVNRIGRDGNEISYSGNSALIDPKGGLLSAFTPHQEAVLTYTLSLKSLEEYRNKFPVGNDADYFSISL